MVHPSLVVGMYGGKLYYLNRTTNIILDNTEYMLYLKNNDGKTNYVEKYDLSLYY